MSPSHKRHVAEQWVQAGRCTIHQICRYLGLRRSTFYYRAKDLSGYAQRLRKAVWEMSVRHAEYGAKKIAKLLREEGWKIGKTLCSTIRRQLGLRIPPKPPRKVRRGQSTGVPTTATHRGHVWSWDFTFHRTVRGGSIKVLSILDEYTRECHRFHVDRRLQARDVQRIMNELIEAHGAPDYIRSDNGSEFIEKHLRSWLASQDIKTLYIDPGCPWQNPYVESLHSQLKRECLHREELRSLSEARVVIENWRIKYNTFRPHGSLKLQSPWAYACELLKSTQADGSGRPSATPPVFLRPQLDSLYQKPTTNLLTINYDLRLT